MNDEIYPLMTGFLEKQDLLNQVFHPENLSGYGTTELHVLKAIHELKSPNVTTLAKALGLTKGAILPGDKVTVEISPYDVTNGCIIYRFK